MTVKSSFAAFQHQAPSLLNENNISTSRITMPSSSKAMSFDSISLTDTKTQQPDMKLVSQVIEGRYIDKGKLADMLVKNFGKGNFRVRV